MLHSYMINFCPQCGQPIQQALRFGAVRPVCAACDYVHFHDPKVAVAAFIVHANQILLVQRGIMPEKGRWALPAGYVDYGEDPIQALHREVTEETGLLLDHIHIVDVMFNDNVIVLVYSGNVMGGNLQAGDDATDARWFTPNNLPDLAFTSTHVLVTRWLNSL